MPQRNVQCIFKDDTLHEMSKKSFAAANYKCNYKIKNNVNIFTNNVGSSAVGYKGTCI